MNRYTARAGDPDYPAVDQFLAEHIPYWIAGSNDATLVYWVDGMDDIRVAYALQHWRPDCGTVIVSAVVAGPLVRDMPLTLFRHIFEQLGCQRATMIVAESNDKSHRICRWLGGRLEGVLTRGSGKEDAVIYGLLIENARPLWRRLKGKRDAEEINLG